MKITKGKYYQGTITQVIVKALKSTNGGERGVFEGIVIVQAKSSDEVGSVSKTYVISLMEEIDYTEDTVKNEFFPLY